MSTSTAPVLLDETSAVAHLRRRGVLDAGEVAAVQSLGGGVSNTVLLVEAPSCRVVVKQALPRLRVEKEWLADPSRTLTEGRALRWAAGVDASAVPPVVDLDEERCVLLIGAAPAGTVDWKQCLLRGEVSSAVAARAGSLVGRLHAESAGRPWLHTDFDCWEAFEQLRVRPYFGAMIEADPSRRDMVMSHVAAMRDRRVCLVHGDVSPKNLLTGGGAGSAPGLLWLIDFEVACAGDPAFDVAFMLTHLCMKALHGAADPGALLHAARAFLTAYRSHAAALLDDERHVAGLLGCLLMARVDGRSPAEYLDERSRGAVRVLGMQLAADPPASLGTALCEALA